MGLFSKPEPIYTPPPQSPPPQISIYILFLIMAVQLGIGIWWASSLTSEVGNQRSIIKEQFHRIEETLKQATKDRITKDEVETKIKFMTVQLRAIEKEINKIHSDSVTDKGDVNKIISDINSKISTHKEEVLDLERTITQIYVRLNANTKNKK